MAAGAGWAPIGASVLADYAQFGQGDGENSARELFTSWQDVRGSTTFKQLLVYAMEHMKLLHAVDTFPNGGLCQGNYLKEAVRRYEQLWLPLLASVRRSEGGNWRALVPPLDVAFVWHLHRLTPVLYVADTGMLLGSGMEFPVEGLQAFAFTDGTDKDGAATARIWAEAHPNEPFYPSVVSSATAEFHSKLTANLAEAAVRQPILLHQLLRAQYLQRPFLNRALDRYAKFLILRKKRSVSLSYAVAPLDIQFLWRTHTSMTATYRRDCQALMGRMLLNDGEDAGTIDRGVAGAWRFHYAETQKEWAQEYPSEPFMQPGAGFIPMDSTHPAELAMTPYLGFYGDSAQQGSWRAGAHALYLSWLLRRGQAAPAAAKAAPSPEPEDSGCCCFGGGGKRKQGGGGGGGGGDAGTSAEGGLRRVAAGFVQFQGLPHSSGHPYWQLLTPRGPNSTAPAEPESADLEEYTSSTSPAAAAAAGQQRRGHANGGSPRKAALVQNGEAAEATGSAVGIDWAALPSS